MKIKHKKNGGVLTGQAGVAAALEGDDVGGARAQVGAELGGGALLEQGLVFHEDDKYVSAVDALIDCVNRSTAQETILSLQSDEPPRNTPTSLMVALNTTTTANALMSAAVSADTSKCAVQGCLSVLVRLIEWHAHHDSQFLLRRIGCQQQV